MKSILITFDQAYYERIVDMLERNNCRGFTAWRIDMPRSRLSEM